MLDGLFGDELFLLKEYQTAAQYATITRMDLGQVRLPHQGWISDQVHNNLTLWVYHINPPSSLSIEKKTASMAVLK